MKSLVHCSLTNKVESQCENQHLLPRTQPPLLKYQHGPFLEKLLIPPLCWPSGGELGLCGMYASSILFCSFFSGVLASEVLGATFLAHSTISENLSPPVFTVTKPLKLSFLKQYAKCECSVRLCGLCFKVTSLPWCGPPMTKNLVIDSSFGSWMNDIIFLSNIA